jgi:hypothetical protein
MDKNTKEILLYNDGTGASADVFLDLENDTVWLTQAQMSELFQRERSAITRHINNIFKEEELEGKSNVQFLHIANSDKPVRIYSLDVIISVGYRVKSNRGIQFRKWASRVLKEYLLRGYAIHRPVTKQELDEVKAELEKQIENLKVITDVQYSELYEALTKLLERKQAAETRRPIGFLRQRDNG